MFSIRTIDIVDNKQVKSVLTKEIEGDLIDLYNETSGDNSEFKNKVLTENALLKTNEWEALYKDESVKNKVIKPKKVVKKDSEE